MERRGGGQIQAVTERKVGEKVEATEAEAEARAINAEPWEPMAGMMKRQCPRCRYFFASLKLPLLRACEALETAEAVLAPAGPQKVAPLRMARIAARLLGKESDGTIAAS